MPARDGRHPCGDRSLAVARHAQPMVTMRGALAILVACALLSAAEPARQEATLNVSLAQAIGARRDLIVYAAGPGRWLALRAGGADTVQCRGTRENLSSVRAITHLPPSVAWLTLGALIDDVDPAWAAGDGQNPTQRGVRAELRWLKAAIATVDRTGRAQQLTRDRMRFTLSRAATPGYVLLIVPE